MIAPLRRFLSVFTLVSRVPFRADFEVDHSRDDFWLPLIGPLASLAALAGLATGGWLFRDALLAALCALTLQYAAFNLFHLDGLLDSADALLSFAGREKRLEILKDSRIGVYAFAAGFFSLTLKAAALAALAPRGGSSPGAIVALLCAPAAGRAAAALIPLLSPPARPTGLGALMRGFSPWRLAAGFLLALTPLGLWSLFSGRLALGGAAAAIALSATLASSLFWAGAYRKKVGGFTGDALGAAVESGELLTLLGMVALAARAGLRP